MRLAVVVLACGSFMFASGALSRPAAADDMPVKPNAAEKSHAQGVHLGSASVTVVDEHEAVDDLISRIRKTEKTPPDKGKRSELPETGRPVAAKSAGGRVLREGSGGSGQVVASTKTWPHAP